MAIIEQYRHGLFAQSGVEDEINSMISVDIARFDLEATNRTDNANRLPSDCGELKLNPVVSDARTAWPSLNAGQIRMMVSVEIGNRKLWARPDRSDGATMNICGCRCASTSEAKQQQERGPQE